ncbi:MAG: hypothetical protein J0H70_01955 [Microbacterium chocolatum]|nr:hypothetical protein [Microbacterium chocolatum]
MAEENLRYVVGRVPDTGDMLATGGTRRADGTLSAQVRDLNYLDDDAVSRLTSNPSRTPSAGRAFAQELGTQVVAVAVDVLLREVVIPGTAKVWRERVAPTINRKWDELRSKKAPATKPEPVELLEVKVEEISERGPHADVEVGGAAIELSRDEAEWRIAEAQRAARELAEHLAILRAARVVDDEDMLALLAGRGQLEGGGQTAIESSPDVVEEPTLEPVPLERKFSLPSGTFPPRQSLPDGDDDEDDARRSSA